MRFLEPPPSLALTLCAAQPDVSRCELSGDGLALFWVNTFMLYAMLRLHAPAGELLKFQSFGWFSILCLVGFQVNTYGFTAQQDTLGIMLTLLGLSAYLGFVP